MRWKLFFTDNLMAFLLGRRYPTRQALVDMFLFSLTLSNKFDVCEESFCNGSRDIFWICTYEHGISERNVFFQMGDRDRKTILIKQLTVYELFQTINEELLRDASSVYGTTLTQACFALVYFEIPCSRIRN